MLAVIAFVLAGCGGSRGFSPPPPFQSPCSAEPQGHLCLNVYEDKGKATEIIAYLSDSSSSLTGKTWRLALGWGESGIAPTSAQHGNPPEQTFCKDSAGQTITTGNGCDDTLAEFRAGLGDFSAFRVPNASLPNPLCLFQQVRENGKWVAGPAKRVCWPS